MYQKILLPVDLEHPNSWEKALPVAIELAKSFGSTVHLVSIVPNLGMSMVSSYLPEGFEAKLLKEAGEKLAAFAAEHIPDGVSHENHVGHGVVRQEIVAAAKKLDCDLIVMAPHRPEMSDFFLSPSTEFVVSHTKRAVLVVR
ncbi:MAG: universal stress protein [Kiloniellales bacterium]|nr:universal stress protein [Kiloniellales bacterium]